LISAKELQGRPGLGLIQAKARNKKAQKLLRFSGVDAICAAA